MLSHRHGKTLLSGVKNKGETLAIKITSRYYVYEAFCRFRKELYEV